MCGEHLNGGMRNLTREMSIFSRINFQILLNLNGTYIFMSYNKHVTSIQEDSGSGSSSHIIVNEGPTIRRSEHGRIPRRFLFESKKEIF